MDWDKAKKVVITVLLILNVGLFGLNFAKNDRYKLSIEQEEAVHQVLSQNGIGIYTEMIRKFYPMRQLTMKVPALETEKLRKIFFEESEEIKITVDFNKTILKSQTKTLTLENNNIIFECPEGLENLPEFTKENARKAANDFVKQLGLGNALFELDSIKELSDSYVFEYYENYNKYKIFSSYNKVTVNKNGVVKLDSAYYEADSFVGEKMSICSPDEALLTFLRASIKEGVQFGMRIENFEIGYDFQEKSEVAEGNSLKMIPCYRITVSGRSEPFVINGYTNKLIH